MLEDRAELEQRFQIVFNRQPEIIACAPGRVNLIGEHTDYNDGYVLPAAIDQEIRVVAAKRDDRMVRILAGDLGSLSIFSLDDIQKIGGDESWSNYPRGVALKLQAEPGPDGEGGYALQGFDGIIIGNVPIGAGLSSSAALEVAFAMTFQALSGFEISPVGMALCCQQAENDFVGVNCGIMDQFISRLGRKGHALLLDCFTLKYELIPLDMQGLKLVVANTNVQRELVYSEYNKRRKTCEDVSQEFSKRIGWLTPEEFAEIAQKLAEIPRKRVGFVVAENQRVKDSAKAILNGDLAGFGRLMNQSHIGLRDEYEVSCFELDTLVDIAWAIPGVLGSRMTGAGFGGCTVTLVKETAVDSLVQAIKTIYPQKTGLQPEVYICSIADGASVSKVPE